MRDADGLGDLGSDFTCETDAWSNCEKLKTRGSDTLTFCGIVEPDAVVAHDRGMAVEQAEGVGGLANTGTLAEPRTLICLEEAVGDITLAPKCEGDGGSGKLTLGEEPPLRTGAPCQEGDETIWRTGA